MNTPRLRLKPKERSRQIIASALTVAESSHYLTASRDAVAKHANVSPNLVSYYLGSLPQLRRSIVRAAIEAENLTVLAQALVARDDHALKAPEALRMRALSLVGARG